MSLLAVLILSIVVITVLFAPSRWALLGMIASALYLTFSQGVDVFGFNMYALRFVEVAGLVRVVLRREITLFRFNDIDRGVLILYVYTTVIFLIRSSEGQVNHIGMALDVLLSYFAFRGLMKSIDELRWFLKAFLVLLTPYVAMVLFESFTTHNLFSPLGPGRDFVWMRGSRVRCFGSFGHPILLGTLGTSFFPLYVGLWFSKNSRAMASIGIGLCLAIIWAANSGAPFSCLLLGVACWMLWRVRSQMRWVRRGILLLIAMLALLMKAPVWFVLDRVSAFTGGAGFHRALLIDLAFRNIDKWWAVGMPIRDTINWMPYSLDITGGVDMTNTFLFFGITAGLAALLLLVSLLTRVCRILGRVLAAIRSDSESQQGNEFLFWGLSVMVVIHIFNWLGTTYFDQMEFIWLMQLAAISSITERMIAPEDFSIDIQSQRPIIKRRNLVVVPNVY